MTGVNSDREPLEVIDGHSRRMRLAGSGGRRLWRLRRYKEMKLSG